MKLYFSLIVVLSVLSFSMGRSLPKRGVLYYQAAPSLMYRRAPSVAHRLMYLQYVHPGSAQQSAEVGPGISAFASGSNVATVLKGGSAESGLQGPAVTSIATSYPSPPPASSVENTAAEEGVQEYDAEQNEILPPPHDQSPEVFRDADDQHKDPNAEDASIPEQDQRDLTEQPPNSAEQPFYGQPPPVSRFDAPAQIPAAVPAAYLPPKKKIHVALDEETDDEYDQPQTFYVPARKKVSKAPSTSKTAPPAAGSYFPIDFGGTSGGAIAIANAYSTGEGGSATSHATAYGSPAQARTTLRKKLAPARH